MMRTLSILLILFEIGNLSVQSNNKKVVITGELKGYNNSAQILYHASPSVATWSVYDTAFADKNGNFSIELSIDAPQIFQMQCEQDKYVIFSPVMLVKPGERHTINGSFTQNLQYNNKASIIGPNSEGQMLFNSVDYNSNELSSLIKFAENWNLSKPETIIDSLNIKIGRAISPFKKLYGAKKIDNDFYNISKNYINYYFANQLLFTIDKALTSMKYSKQKEQLEKINSEIFKSYPVSNNDIIHSSFFYNYVAYYISFLNKINQKEHDSYAAKGLTQTYELNNVKKVLTKEAYKYYAISYISGHALLKDKETLDLFDQYKLEYPNFTENRYYQRLVKYIPTIKELYTPKDNQLPDELVILDKDKSINSFADLTARFSGKPFFIDCWATWCGACLLQFGFNKPLKEFLSKNDIELVYIAFEKTLSKEKLEIFINKYNLAGYHMTTNDSFEKDLKSKLGIDKSVLRVPRYILVNKTGIIVINDALHPSEKERLYDQIKSNLPK